MASRATLLVVFALACPLLSSCSRHSAEDALSPVPRLDQSTWFDLGALCEGDSPRRLAPISSSDSLENILFPVTADPNRRSAWVARHLPGGFGGTFYRQMDRDPAVYLRDTTMKGQVLLALGALPDVGVSREMLNRASVLQARWDLTELYDWSQYLKGEVGLRNGINGWGIRVSSNRIVLSFSPENPNGVAIVSQQLRNLAVPCLLIGYESGRAITTGR